METQPDIPPLLDLHALSAHFQTLQAAHADISTILRNFDNANTPEEGRDCFYLRSDVSVLRATHRHIMEGKQQMTAAAGSFLLDGSFIFTVTFQ